MKAIYYILQGTWGLPMNVIGILVYAFFRFVGFEAKRHGGCFFIPLGKCWGGFSLGMFFFCDRRETEYIKNHEFGHSLQNCFLGALMIPLTILSIARYHYRNLITKRGTPCNTPYDSFWFEGQATRLGNKYIQKFKKGDD